MAGVEVAEGLEAELGTVVPTHSGDGSEHQADMVAGVEPVDDFTCEPSGAFGEHRRATMGPRLPLAPRELVDVIARLLAKEPGQLLVGDAKGVDHYQLGFRHHVERPVELRDADVPARGMDAALR